MTIKNVLVPLDGSDSDRVVSEIAFRIARDFGARIDGIFARGSELDREALMLIGLDEAVHADVFDSARARTEQREVAARQSFGAILERVKEEAPGAVTALLEVVDSGTADAIIERGGTYDLLVVARPDVGAPESARAVAEAALFHTGRPVLLAPAEAPETLGRRVLIAWNRSPQAGRAVASAMPFLERAEATVIFHVDTGAKRGPPAGRLRQYLGLHGVDAGVVEAPPDYRPVGEQVLDQAHDFDADMIVMGAYSKSRWRERLLGGVTRFTFAGADVPVLMAR